MTSTAQSFLDAFHASSTLDFAQLTERYFAPQAQYQPLVPMCTPAIGRDNVRRELERQLPTC